MPNNTTAPAGQAEGENWEARYTGLQKVLSKRDAELAAATKALEDRQAAFESDAAELRTIREQRAAEQAEKDEQARYEALRAKYEPDSPTPGQHSEFNSQRFASNDPSVEDLKRKLDKLEGKPSVSHEWPDISAT